MDIDDPTEVATIRDEVTAQWGGGMDLKTYKRDNKISNSGTYQHNQPERTKRTSYQI
jgi:hypothetical protein